MSDKNIDRALLVLRIVVGTMFIAHGWQKVFGMGLGNVAGMFGKMGIPMASIVGPGIAILELVGGAAVLLGIFTRPIALLLAIDMLGAIALVHGKNGFFMPMGMELVFMNFGAALALAFAGAGSLSVDATMGKQGSTTA